MNITQKGCVSLFLVLITETHERKNLINYNLKLRHSFDNKKSKKTFRFKD